MQTLILHTPKGGSGKSTMARELAVAASATMRTAMADLDPQGTATGWYQRRQAKEPALVTLQPGKSTKHLAAAGVELLVIDTPPGQPAFLPALLASGHVVLVPVRPTPDDLLAAAPIARSLGRHPAWAFVLTQVPPRTRLLASAIRQLASLGRVAPVQMTFRADYPAAAIEGMAAFEYTGKASEETAALWKYTLDLLEPDMAKPRADLDALTVPKRGDAAQAASPAAPAGKAYAHTLSLRLTAEQYRRLRRFVAAEEDRTSQRLTHQAIIETALAEYLDKAGG